MLSQKWQLVVAAAAILAVAGMVWAYVWPQDEQKLRRQIGHTVIEEAVMRAKEVVPVTEAVEKSAVSKFWGRLKSLFNVVP